MYSFLCERNKICPCITFAANTVIDFLSLEKLFAVVVIFSFLIDVWCQSLVQLIDGSNLSLICLNLGPCLSTFFELFQCFQNLRRLSQPTGTF